MRSVVIRMLLKSQIRPESTMIGRQRSEGSFMESRDGNLWGCAFVGRRNGLWTHITSIWNGSWERGGQERPRETSQES